jgi:hypothetical protein
MCGKVKLLMKFKQISPAVCANNAPIALPSAHWDATSGNEAPRQRTNYLHAWAFHGLI